MARVKYVKERIGEEVSDWSQLLQRRQRREERRRLQELERQKELQRRREAGEIPEVPTGATTAANPNVPSGPATSITPFTRRVTRAAARAASNSAISNTTTATTTTMDTPTVMAPVSAPASASGNVTAVDLPTVITDAADHEEYGYMDLVDPALFEFGNDDNVAELPANDAVSSVQASMPTTSKNAAPPSFTPATAPAAVSAYAIDVEEHPVMDRSQPRNVGTVHQQAMMPRTAQGNQEVVQPTTDARTKAALQLVPVVDIINRLFAESLPRLRAPTLEMVAAEARVFLARARENETVQAVRKAARTLEFEVLHRINEFSAQQDLRTEVLKFRLQQVFLDELGK
ncbi:hypothetical protein NEUTE1DRAFT_46394 [Neurospora tetrasperma FGSC 2508]|uniref:Uncharacterized protein n=1 Tax=Neurospora tetrasperma (strain FGSC 2508 / ATCC MYA-4615 / P0657) TaxID=510951 RepID=F8MT55_NEUT8|nr:uncharacterized protein NEUTE1DRAFT_46394 [Neurospora tetrasperma FGSC 2508]EGO55187.1 hypothetical protein NEUTE1DRAFT_46394 [Neurospora tetrasperma FGSC 2508]EGZ69597.1 hypothetical protein NEUTE2DRAFT_131995 [Neurospora tetrasperma FGSC 2509]